MNLQKIVVLCVVGIVIVGGAFLLIRDSANAPSTEEIAGDASEQSADTEVQTDGLQSEKTSGVGSLRDLMMLGRSLECDYTFASTEGGEGRGTSYVDGNRMRTDFIMTQDGETFDSHMIHDGTTVYSWTTGSEGSFAIMFDAPSDTPDEFETVANPDSSQAALDDDVTYDCSGWRVDASKFIPPRDVEFVDMESLFNEVFEDLPIPQ